MHSCRRRLEETEIVSLRTWARFGTLYDRIKIYSVLANNVWESLIVPGSTVLMILESVSAIYCTLRLHGQVHPLAYAFFPALAVFAVGGVLVGLYGELTKVNRNSNACVDDIVNAGRQLRVSLARSGCDQISLEYVGRRLKTFRSFGIQNGGFGFITIDTQFAMLDEIINYVLLLLSL